MCGYDVKERLVKIDDVVKCTILRRLNRFVVEIIVGNHLLRLT